MRKIIRTENFKTLPQQSLSFQAFLLTMLLSAAAWGQSDIRRDVLGDQVERWHRFKTADQRPWFFQQLETLFNVVLPPKDQLPFGISVAFLIGVSQYDYLGPQLPFVQNDLRDMREFLLAKGGFDTVYVAGEKIVNRDLIEDYMRNKFARLNKRDRLLFYYSGHGDDSGGKTGYMQFAKARPNNFAGPQVLAINDASDWCSEIDVDHLLFIFDCCASGLAFTSKGIPGEAYSQMIATLSRNGSRVVMTAGTAEEKTYEVASRSGKGNGVFTRAFLNATETGLADKSNDGFMTSEEIFAQIKDEVANFSVTHKQSLTPRLWSLEEAQYRGTFIFVNPEARNRRIPLSEEYSRKLNVRGDVIAAFGSVRLISYLAGRIYIDDKERGVVRESGDAKEFDLEVGPHTIQVKGQNETVSKNITVIKGETTTITISPTTPAPSPPKPAPKFTLRREERNNFSAEEFAEMLETKGFFDSGRNENGKGMANQFELQTSNGDQVVIDHATGLMWQQSGSPNQVPYSEVVNQLVILKMGHAGYRDWRLPTLEEAMSLVEPRRHGNLYIDPKFDQKQEWIWTADQSDTGWAWVVNFYGGFAGIHQVQLPYNVFHVRAVRSIP